MLWERLHVGDREVTRQQYQSLPREERLALAEEMCEALRRAHSIQSELLRSIRQEVDERYAPLLAAVPRRLPPVKPRRKGDPNPEWERLTWEREETHRRLVATIPPVRSSHSWMGALQQAFRAWELEVETPKDELARLLREHDWHYAMSDDHRYWSAGERRSRRILALVEQLGPEARAAYERACPWETERPPAGHP
jgi:hypothetical protein